MLQYRLKARFELIQLLPNGDAVIQNAGDSSHTWIVSAAQLASDYEVVI